MTSHLLHRRWDDAEDGTSAAECGVELADREELPVFEALEPEPDEAGRLAGLPEAAPWLRSPSHRPSLCFIILLP